MVYNTQNYWGFGLFSLSCILENTTFRKLDLFPFSGEGGGEDTYSVGPLDTANLNDSFSVAKLSRCLLLHLHLRTVKDLQFPKRRVS
jgi:hypothetical protein